MTIGNAELGLLLARVWFNGPEKWYAQSMEEKKVWYAVAAKARELLTPASRTIDLAPLVDDPGPLQPGDVVSVRGVVHELDPPHPYINVTIDGYRGTGIGAGMLWLESQHVTFIERPAPPEPDWQPGDVAKSDGPKGDGTLYRYWPENGGHAPWLSLHRAAHVRWVGREKIPGTLTPCDVVPRKVK